MDLLYIHLIVWNVDYIDLVMIQTLLQGIPVPIILWYVHSSGAIILMGKRELGPISSTSLRRVFCLKNIVRSSYVKNRVSSNY